MREILFRGKRVNGEWKYGNLLVAGANKDVYYIMEFAEQHYRVETETVGQYTGINDRNGKRIFEGDIILARYREHDFPQHWAKGYVVFENGTFKIKVTESNNAVEHKLYCDEKVLAFSIENNFLNRHYKLEVIGNIYDTKEAIV